ncbi:duf895 domain membrane protein [Colletotrichum asianum]|uniref:Duf895 domain membrane protein n=1 Tax=Colletotrichum asianum TaxID=702518 RepID=A0A8H3W284_9PEZI|nr:duf895 domain membrane protein [Colletotrichum asianum]
MAEEPTKTPVSEVQDHAPASEPVKRVWYHSTLFNAFVIGGVGFMAPGLWNAMNALGAGGAQEPFLVNAANALVFGLMGFLSLRRPHRQPEGAVALGYPEPAKRGKYMNIWLWFRTGGPLVGGAIVLALNNDAGAKKKGKVGYETYLVFIALQCLSVPLALALSPPEKVQRTDGSKVIIKAEKSFSAELRELFRISKRKDVLLLLPIFWAAYFNQYSGNFQSYYFGVRARALIGFVSNFGTLLSSQLISTLLDYKGFSVKKRINIGLYYVVVWHIIAWVYGWVIQEKYTANPPAYDWEDKGFTEGFFVLLLWDLARQALQNWLYYLLATKTNNISELARFSGVLRGQESFAQAVAFGLNTRKWHGGRVPLAINTILLGLAVYPTWLVVRDHVPIETDKLATVEEGSQGELAETRLSADERKEFAIGQTGLGRDAKI